MNLAFERPQHFGCGRNITQQELGGLGTEFRRSRADLARRYLRTATEIFLAAANLGTIRGR